MKIALSTTMIQGGRSGVAQYVLALLRELIPLCGEHELSVLVLEKDLPLFEFAAPHVRLVPVSERWRSAVKNILWHQAVLPQWLRREGIDVLHVPSYRRLVAHAPCATVATIHDLAPFHVSAKYDAARMFYGRVVVKHLARRQNRVVAISRQTSGDIERFFGIPASSQSLVHNGIDHARFCPGESKAPERPYFLYVSRLEHPAKNHVRLIEAFDQFRKRTKLEWDLVLAGGDWHGAEHIRAAARQSGSAAHIRFPGFVPDADLPALYRSAGAMVYPSLFEGFGLPPVEAMACGCPVVSSSAGALDEVIGDAALRIDPNDPVSIADALVEIASNPARRERLRELGLANARRFDWAVTARRMLGIYEEAVESAVAGHATHLGGWSVGGMDSSVDSEPIPTRHVRLSQSLEPDRQAV